MFVRSIPLTYKSLPFPQEIFVLLVFLASWWCHFKNLTAKTPRAPRTPNKLRLYRPREIRVKPCPTPLPLHTSPAV